VVVIAVLAVAGFAAPAGARVTAVQVPATGASAVVAPTAAIGAFDCERLQVEIRLDNSRSTGAVTYGYSAAFRSPLHAPYRGADARVDVEVAAGRSTVVVLPVRDDARTDVTVHLPDGGHVFSQGSCGNAPGATFGLSRCDALRLRLTLDNSTSRMPTRYRWAVADPAGPVRSETVDVDAGDVVGVDLALVPDSWTDVVVTVDGRGPVASSDRQACGRVVLDPRASFGAVDCTDVSAPVLLDNSRTTARLRFTLPGRSVVLGAGETRALRLHLPLSERVVVTVDDVLADGASAERAVTSTARCAEAPPSPDAGTAAREEAAAGAVAPDLRAVAPDAVAPDRGARVPDAVASDAVAATGSTPWLAIGTCALLLAGGLGLLVSRHRRARTG
jgi:hypothetical protein